MNITDKLEYHVSMDKKFAEIAAVSIFSVYV